MRRKERGRERCGSKSFQLLFKQSRLRSYPHVFFLTAAAIPRVREQVELVLRLVYSIVWCTIGKMHGGKVKNVVSSMLGAPAVVD